MPPPVLFCFDYLDPLSFILDAELLSLSAQATLPQIRRIPLELRAPPSPLIAPDASTWVERWQAAGPVAAGLGVTLEPPPFLPWTRKAHELALHASGKGMGDVAHAALFRAALQEGRDIGRVDVLVEIARTLGLDAQEAKAVLDVDRYAGAVAALGDEARAAGADQPPTFVRDGQLLQGFHNRDALRTFLLR